MVLTYPETGWTCLLYILAIKINGIYGALTVFQSQEFLLMNLREITANPKPAEHYLFDHSLIPEMTPNQKKNQELVTYTHFAA